MWFFTQQCMMERRCESFEFQVLEVRFYLKHGLNEFGFSYIVSGFISL